MAQAQQDARGYTSKHYTNAPVDENGYTEFVEFRNVSSRSRQDRRNSMDKEVSFAVCLSCSRPRRFACVIVFAVSLQCALVIVVVWVLLFGCCCLSFVDVFIFFFFDVL